MLSHSCYLELLRHTSLDDIGESEERSHSKDLVHQLMQHYSPNPA